MELEVRQSQATGKQTRSVDKKFGAGARKGGVVSILRAKNAGLISIRFADPRDWEGLQAYIRSLSVGARYNRFLGATSELPETLLEQFVRIAEAGPLTMLATMLLDGCETIVGKARYALDAETSRVEVALSVHDTWQGHGIGKSLLKQLEALAAVSGAAQIFGDTLRINERMIGLARERGYASVANPDRGLLRLERSLGLAMPV